MADISTDMTSPKTRLLWPDIARSVALIAMASYHFMWDLQFFGYVADDFATSGLPKIYARAIASSFLFLVGISLVLAHKDQFNGPKFLRRTAILGGAAAIISVATWFFSPDSFIYFGILHAILLFSILALPFLRLPVIIALLVGMATIALPFWFKSDIFNHPALWWVGLSTIPGRSSDYVPLFPWFGAVLLGIAFMRILRDRGLLISGSASSTKAPKLAWLGRHSLAFYLVHQPILISVVYVVSQFAPPPPVDPVALYLKNCQTSCVRTQTAATCEAFCSCTVSKLMEQSLFTPMMKGEILANNDTRILRIGAECSEEAF